MERRSYRRLRVALRKRDRERVRELLRKGEVSARVLRRVEMLQMLDRGWTAGGIEDALGVSPTTVRRIGRRYMEEGLKSALKERPRPGNPRLLSDREEARIIAMVCSEAPQGHARWTVRLIVEEAVRRKLVRQVGRETIRILLKNHDLKPWREKNVVRSGAGR